MQSAQSPKLEATHLSGPRAVVKRCLVAAAIVLVLGSASGCVAPALYALPCVLESAVVVVARSLPMDDHRLIADSPRAEDEPALALATEAEDMPGEVAKISRPADERISAKQSAAAKADTVPLVPVASAADAGPGRPKLPVRGR